MSDFPFLSEPQVEELEEYGLTELTDELMDEMMAFFGQSSAEETTTTTV